MTLKDIAAKIFTKGALHVIGYVAFGGYAMYKIDQIVTEVGNKIDVKITQSESKQIKAIESGKEDTNGAIQAIFCKMEALDSAVNKSSDKELNRLRRENWQLLKDKYDLLNEKKNENRSLNILKDYRPELS